MIRLIKADFKKMIYIPNYRYLLIASFILSILFGLIFLTTIGVTEGRPLIDLSNIEVMDVSFLGVDVAAIMMIVFAALFISKEISDGVIYINLTITPKRLKFFGLKLLFLSLLGILLSGFVIAGLFSVNWFVMAINNMGGFEWFSKSVMYKIIGSVLMILFYSLLSAIGVFFTQSLSGGIILSLGTMFLPGLIRMFPKIVGDLLLPLFPETAINSLVDLTMSSSNLFRSLLILIFWLIISTAIGYGKFKKIDY